LVDEFSQLEHRHLFPTAEHGQKFFVRVDVCLILWILEAMFTDIFPDLFGEAPYAEVARSLRRPTARRQAGQIYLMRYCVLLRQQLFSMTAWINNARMAVRGQA
jgi:hypothetical protein